MPGRSIPPHLKRRSSQFVALAAATFVTVLMTSSIVAATGGVASASTIAQQDTASASAATDLSTVTPRVVHPSGGVSQPSVGGPQDLDAKPPPSMRGGTPTTGLPPVIGDSLRNDDITTTAGVNTTAGLVTPFTATGSFGTLNSFTGVTFANTCTLNGSSCNGSEPPDTQMAAGTTEIVESVNNNVFVYDRSGTLLNSYAMTAIFQPPGQTVGVTDPKIVFDPTTNRFYATEMVCQNAGCGASTWTHMGISFAESSDPATGWSVYDYLNDGQDLQDQEKLGFSGDKITFAVNEYGCKCGAGTKFKQENVIVIQKSDAVVAATITPVVFNDSSGSTYRFDSMPTTPINASTSDNTQYVVWDGNQTSNNSMQLVRITGTPDAHNVDFTSNSTSIGIANQTKPPTPVEEGGNLAGDKQNFQSATVQGNDLWAVATDGCTPQFPNPDTTTRNCTRLVEVDLGSNSVVTDTDVGTDGTDRINPSVSKDSAGHVFFGFTIASATTFATAAIDASATPLPSVLQRIDLAAGDQTYGGGRWGDYSGTQQDPANTNDVWTAQEFGGCSTGCNPAFSGGALWATELAQLTFRDPHINSISPAQGFTTGGTLVDIFGSEFANGGTSVEFGNNFSPSVKWIDSTHIQAVSPPGSGTVDVTATTNTGTSDTSPADQFTYVLDDDLSITQPSNITVNPNGPGGAVVTYPLPTVSDPDDATSPTPSCSPPSGSTFPIGTTTVHCSVSDPDDTNSPQATTFTVTVNDSDLALTNVPANQTVNATSPQGAVVSYTPPTVVDEDNPLPTVSCTSPSGSTFAIGLNTVTCTVSATGDTNSPVSKSFTINVLGAAAQLANLQSVVTGVGPGKSLAQKVSAAQADVAANNTAGACGVLAAFINEVKAQTGKSISPSTAASLIASATNIRAVLGC